MRGVILICCALVFLLPSGKSTPTPEPTRNDCLSEAYAADRAGRVSMLREMDRTEFRNDKEKAEWHLERSRDLLAEAYQPYLDAVAESIVAGTVQKLADELDAVQ